MAPRAVAGLLACAGAVCARAAAPELWDWKAHELGRIKRGEVGKDELEVVLAQYKEDTSWSDDYKHVRTVYCKGGSSCQEDTIGLPNIGREAHTFFHHIVTNYDKLANWTVFSQAEEPTEGYKGQGKGGGGHMLTGVSFEDYMLHPHRPDQEDPEAFFLMTQKMHLQTMRHAVRSTYKIGDGQNAQRKGRLPRMCPGPRAAAQGISPDVWGPLKDMSWLRRFLAKKCSVTEEGIREGIMIFWDHYVNLPRPPSNIVHFAQGARFAVSRDRIRQRPRAFYQEMLESVSTDADPCLSYMFEWAWWYVVGKPQRSPCRISKNPKRIPLQVRQLKGLGKGDDGIEMVEYDDEWDDEWQRDRMPYDNDVCLQKSPEWGPDYTCEDSTEWCKEYAKDMMRCCPVSCGRTAPLTEEECHRLDSYGECFYPESEGLPGGFSGRPVPIYDEGFSGGFSGRPVPVYDDEMYEPTFDESDRTDGRQPKCVMIEKSVAEAIQAVACPLAK